jgi:ABC-2 type transport system permease protein
MGIGLLLSCVSVFLRDMFYIYGIILTIWNYLTPIFYSVSIIPDEILPFYVQNPLYIYITAVRNIVLLGERPSITMLGVCTLWAIGSLVFGSIVFKKNQDKFIYYI